MLAALTFGAPAAQLPCRSGDKACAIRAMHASPAKRADFWRGALARPVAERIGPAPPELVELLQLDVMANGYPNQPRPSSPDPAFVADVRRAFEAIPEAVRRLLEPKLAGIHFVDDIGGTGFTDVTVEHTLGFIVLDPTVLSRQTANAWATWKDNTPFRPDPAFRLETRIADPARDDRMHAIQYILLHEIGHVLSIGADVHPRWDLPAAQAAAKGSFPFYDLSWTIQEGRYASKFDAGFPKRRDVRFYFGAALDAADMLAVYDALEKTLGPCWGEARCARKRTALEDALRLPAARN